MCDFHAVLEFCGWGIICALSAKNTSPFFFFVLLNKELNFLIDYIRGILANPLWISLTLNPDKDTSSKLPKKTLFLSALHFAKFRTKKRTCRAWDQSDFLWSLVIMSKNQQVFFSKTWTNSEISVKKFFKSKTKNKMIT